MITAAQPDLRKIFDGYPEEPRYLVEVLQDIQEASGYLSEDAIRAASDRLRVPLIEVYRVASFYKAFSLVPKGRHQVHVCMGTACHVRGAPRILGKVEDHTGIKSGETDLDLKFSLETVNCLGCCALGPVMEIGGKTHGKIAPGETADVLKSYE